MWIRLIAGLVLCAAGALWIAQGVGAAKGSMMTGHPAAMPEEAGRRRADRRTVSSCSTAWRARRGKHPQP